MLSASFLPLDLGRLGLQFHGHVAQAFGAGEIETGPGNLKAGFSLAAEVLGGQHSRSFPGSWSWLDVSFDNPPMLQRHSRSPSTDLVYVDF
jgi:hypothetical protein